MQLGRHLYNHRGDVLLAGGTQLTDAFIASIRQRGYQSVYIMDGIADDVEPRGLISQRLRSTVAVFPVGVHVQFGGGKYAGSYGVVVKCTPGAANRPVVRLLFDAQGAPVPEGVEVDLRKQADDAELTAGPEEGVSVEEYAHRLAITSH